MKQTISSPPLVGSHSGAAPIMVAAMVIIGISDNAVPLMAEQIGIWQFYLMRTVIALPLVWVMMQAGLGSLRPGRMWAVALRGMLVAVSMVFYFSAVALMPLAQALAGLFTSPILIVLISVLVLKQRIGPIRVTAVALGFLGVLLVLQPDPANFDWLILLPVCGGLFYALGSMATGLMCREESTVSMLFAMLLAQALIGAVALGGLALWPLPVAEGADGFVTRGWVWPIWPVSHWVLLQGVASVLGVFLITKAYQLGEASYVAVFEYSVIIVGPAFAWMVFGQSLEPMQIAGIALIVLAGGTIALRGG
ncbi:DMT family transporter [Phaeobacter sp. QD34_3]|uniref:DMT family transporter n=1 Tax=unclassified Phaeobacter TaxID=2621772 RepID=UPI00237F7A10|nr:MULTISPECIES: DMT family transporter [unclassified Phaeobacter]MDE4131529.1 DMT family transporter [Phaeobacter sp. QD34_3]MDE4135382.1 DMT family transporter [Phaeobacter sp. QD34_24]MDE4175483.1 DMT family transporter [Phaeobacter sp. PT47_59]